MEIQYVIINFLILAAIIILFARKTIIRLFRNRRQAILRDLDEAQELEKTGLPVFEEPIFEADTPEDAAELCEAKKQTDEKLADIYAFGERECKEMRRLMIQKTRRKFFDTLKTSVAEVFVREPYLSAMRAKESEQIDKILSMIKLTPGDMSYLCRHDVLYVTLTSAYLLDEALVKKVDEAATKLVAAVNGKISLWVKQDPSLIGGLRLRIGDTVYDGTVLDEIYHYHEKVKKSPVTSEDDYGEVYAAFASEARIHTPEIRTYQLGRVIQISDGICWMDGLADIMYGEVVEFDCGERGMVLDIQPERIGCVIFGEYEHIDSGSPVRRVGRIASVPVGEGLLGRVVDPRGNPIDGEGYIYHSEKRPIECKAPGILDRAAVDKPLHTGIKAIDALVPIGRGQRELIIGDRQTGKSAIAVDAIINQKGKDVICIYVAIGQKDTTIADIKDKLTKYGAMEYTTIVAAPASGSAATQYIAPFAGTAMAEYFMYSGRDVLIIYDDLSKHAVAYRELSLLLHRPSGREAYPGDIFYLHSRLLERSAHLSAELGGGSITALPIIETLAGDISAYIPTNVISITDGQIFLESELFNSGQRPAVNYGLSVSRVGGAAQSPVMKKVSSSLRTRLAQYRELAEFMQFGSDIDDATAATLASGRLLTEALRQGRYEPINDEIQAILIFAVSEGYAKSIKPEQMSSFEKSLYAYLTKEKASLCEKIRTARKLDDNLKQELKEALDEFVKRF